MIRNIYNMLLFHTYPTQPQPSHSTPPIPLYPTHPTHLSQFTPSNIKTYFPYGSLEPVERERYTRSSLYSTVLTIFRF